MSLNFIQWAQCQLWRGSMRERVSMAVSLMWVPCIKLLGLTVPLFGAEWVTVWTLQRLCVPGTVLPSWPSTVFSVLYIRDIFNFILWAKKNNAKKIRCATKHQQEKLFYIWVQYSEKEEEFIGCTGPNRFFTPLALSKKKNGSVTTKKYNVQETIITSQLSLAYQRLLSMSHFLCVLFVDLVSLCGPTCAQSCMLERRTTYRGPKWCTALNAVLRRLPSHCHYLLYYRTLLHHIPRVTARNTNHPSVATSLPCSFAPTVEPHWYFYTVHLL